MTKPHYGDAHLLGWHAPMSHSFTHLSCRAFGPRNLMKINQS